MIPAPNLDVENPSIPCRDILMRYSLWGYLTCRKYFGGTAYVLKVNCVLILLQPREGVMSRFTKAEIDAELKGRADAIEQRNMATQFLPAPPPDGDTTCLHCGNPMFSWQATDAENSICEICL